MLVFYRVFKMAHYPVNQYQKLMERYLGEVDKVLADLKKATGAK